MEKKTVKIGGYDVTQLSDTEYEIANPKETLDFLFETSDPEEVSVFIFDSLRPNKDEPFLAVFSTPTLEEAIVDSMKFTKADIINRAVMTWD